MKHAPVCRFCKSARSGPGSSSRAAAPRMSSSSWHMCCVIIDAAARSLGGREQQSELCVSALSSCTTAASRSRRLANGWLPLSSHKHSRRWLVGAHPPVTCMHASCAAYRTHASTPHTHAANQQKGLITDSRISSSQKQRPFGRLLSFQSRLVFCLVRCIAGPWHRFVSFQSNSGMIAQITSCVHFYCSLCSTPMCPCSMLPVQHLQRLLNNNHLFFWEVRLNANMRMHIHVMDVRMHVRVHACSMFEHKDIIYIRIETHVFQCTVLVHVSRPPLVPVSVQTFCTKITL